MLYSNYSSESKLMKNKLDKSQPKNKSLLFAIEDVAKLLRTEVKKKESKLKKTVTARSHNASSPDFVNSIQQIAKLLRMQTQDVSTKKRHGWKLVRKKDTKTPKK